jgi:hypothetical protein
MRRGSYEKGDVGGPRHPGNRFPKSETSPPGPRKMRARENAGDGRSPAIVVETDREIAVPF